jgi:hypothetical protein
MTIATLSRTRSTTEVIYEGALTSDKPITFGLSSPCHLTSFRLTVLERETGFYYELSLRGEQINRFGGTFALPRAGKWGYPVATTAIPDDYGYGSCGLISEVAPDILRAIEGLTGVKLTEMI